MSEKSAPGYQGSSKPRKLTVIVLLVLVAVTPVYVAGALVVGVPFYGFFSKGLPAPAPTPAIVGTSGASPITNTSALCANVTKYVGEDSTNPADTNINESFPIFSIKAGSTSEVCLSFYNHDDPTTVSLNLGEVISIGNYQSQTFVNGTTVTKFVSASPKITVTPAQPNLLLNGSTVQPFPAGGAGGTLLQDQATVAFMINATKAAVGTYFINIAGGAPASCQGEFRLAVGLTFTPANATGPYFELPPGVGGCAAGMGVVHSHILGVDNIAVTYLNCNMFSCDINRPTL